MDATSTELTVEDALQEEKERLRDAAAIETEELKDAVEELATAAQSEAYEALEMGRWASLYAAFALGFLVGLRGQTDPPR